jgi:hypothetical protein
MTRLLFPHPVKVQEKVKNKRVLAVFQSVSGLMAHPVVSVSDIDTIGSVMRSQEASAYIEGK